MDAALHTPLDLDALEKVARETQSAVERDLSAWDEEQGFCATFGPPTVLRLIETQRELLAALAELRHICADIPAIERNPRFAAANMKALAAIAKANGEQPSLSTSEGEG